MKFKLKYIMLFLALSVAGCAAYFSILGLSQLFAGASTAVIIMASVLELGKIVTTTALHTYWSKLAKTLRIYLAISVIILMLITSVGIYGFLSNAYQSTANKLEIHEGELGVIEAKKITFEKSLNDNKKLIETKIRRLDQLSNLRINQESRIDKSISNRLINNVRSDIKSADNEIQKLNNEIDLLNTKNIVLSDSINKYNVKIIEVKSNNAVAAEIGPLKYIAQLTGISMANIVNYLILLLIFVFDPLAVALVLITNRVFELEKEIITENNTDNTKKVLDETVENIDEPSLENISPKINIEEFYDNNLNEHTEFVDDETIEEPEFENILDPIDENFIDEQTSETNLLEEPIEIKKDFLIPSSKESIENIDSEIEKEPLIEEEFYIPKGKISLDDIKEIKERKRGFSVNVPEPRRNNIIKRITRN